MMALDAAFGLRRTRRNDGDPQLRAHATEVGQRLGPRRVGSRGRNLLIEQTVNLWQPEVLRGGGGTVTGTVNARTKLECKAAATAARDGSGDGSGDGDRSGSNSDAAYQACAADSRVVLSQ